MNKVECDVENNFHQICSNSVVSTPKTADINSDYDMKASSSNEILKSLNYMIESLSNNSKYMGNILKDQKEKIKIDTMFIIKNLEESQNKYLKVIESHNTFYEQTKAKLERFVKKDNASKNETEELFSLIKNSTDNKTIFELIKFFCGKIGNIEKFNENIREFENKFLQKKHKKMAKEEEVIEKEKEKSNTSTALIKEFYTYFMQNRPPYCIFVKPRKRIFINYYLESGKRTTKSYNMANLKSLNEFKQLMGEVIQFINTHRIKKHSS